MVCEQVVQLAHLQDAWEPFQKSVSVKPLRPVGGRYPETTQFQLYHPRQHPFAFPQTPLVISGQYVMYSIALMLPQLLCLILTLESSCRIKPDRPT